MWTNHLIHNVPQTSYGNRVHCWIHSYRCEPSLYTGDILCQPYSLLFILHMWSAYSIKVSHSLYIIHMNHWHTNSTAFTVVYIHIDEYPHSIQVTHHVNRVHCCIYSCRCESSLYTGDMLCQPRSPLYIFIQMHVNPHSIRVTYYVNRGHCWT